MTHEFAVRYAGLERGSRIAGIAVETLAEAEELHLIPAFGSCPEAPQLGLFQLVIVDLGGLNLADVTPNLTIESA
jgi:hypothetical protein